jgi:hypothetical protein
MHLHFLAPFIFLVYAKLFIKIANETQPAIPPRLDNQYNLKTQSRRISIHNNKCGDIAVRGERMRKNVANIVDVKETESDQINFPTFKIPLCQDKFSKTG